MCGSSRALTRADLRLARGGELGLLLGECPLIEPCPQDAHRTLPVLQLGLLVLHRDNDPGWLVRDPHRRVGRVDRLTAGPGAPVHVDLEIVLIDVDLDIVDLGEYRHGRRRGMDPALGLGLGDALNAMRSAFELEHANTRRRP